MPLTYSEFGDISNETPQQQVASMFQQEETNPLQQTQEQPVKYKPVQDFKYDAIDLIQNSIDWQYLNDEQKQKALEMAQTRQGAMELITTSQDWQQLNDEQRQKLLSGLYTPEDVKARDELITKQGYQTITPETYQTYKETGQLISPEQQQQADKEAQATYERLYEQSKGGEITPAGFSPEDVQTAKWEHLQKQYPVLSTAAYNVGESFGNIAATFYKLTGNEDKLKDTLNTLEQAQKAYESSEQISGKTTGQKLAGEALGMLADPVNIALIGADLLTAGAANLAAEGRLGSYAAKLVSSLNKVDDVTKMVAIPALQGAGFGFLEDYGKVKDNKELLDSMLVGSAFFVGMTNIAKILHETGKIAYDKFKDITSKLNVAKKGNKKVAQEVFSELNNELEKLPEKEAQEISNKAVNNSIVELETKANEFAKQYGQEVNIDEVNPKELGTATDIKEQIIKQRQDEDLAGKLQRMVDYGYISNEKAAKILSDIKNMEIKGQTSLRDIFNKYPDFEYFVNEDKISPKDVGTLDKIKSKTTELISKEDIENAIRRLYDIGKLSNHKANTILSHIKRIYKLPEEQRLKSLRGLFDKFPEIKTFIEEGNIKAPQDIGSGVIEGLSKETQTEKAIRLYNEGKISLDELNNIIQSNNKPEIPLRASETPVIEQTGEDIGKIISETEKPVETQIKDEELGVKTKPNSTIENVIIKDKETGDKLQGKMVNIQRDDKGNIKMFDFVDKDGNKEVGLFPEHWDIISENNNKDKGFISPTLAKSMAARGGGALIGGTIGYKSSDKDDNLWEKFGKTATGAAVGAAIGGLGLYRDMLKTTKSEEIIKKIPLLDKPSKFVLDGHGLGTLSDEAKDFVLNEAYYGTYRPILGKKGELADRLLKKLKDLGVTNYSTHEQAIKYLTNPEYRAEIASKLDKLPDDIRDKAKELFGTLDKFRRIIDANSAELLMRGKLLLPAYVKNLEKYTRRQYLGKKGGLDNIPTIKYGKKYMDLIGETTPEEREAMGYIADVEGELAATSVLQNKLIAWDEYTRKLFKGALDKELDILAPNAKDYIVELPESLRLMKLPYKMSAAYAKNELLGKYGNLRTMYQWLNLYEKGELKGDVQNELIKQYVDELKTKGITLDQAKKDFREFIKDVNKKYAAMSKLEPAKSAFAKWDVLPKDKKYGVLAGLPMDKSLVNQLAALQVIDKTPITTAKTIQKQFGKLLSIFRWAKTVGGMPYSLSKNFLGNWAQWVAGGGSVQTFPAYFVRGLYEINRKGKLYDMLKRKGLLHENYAEYEVRKQLQQAFGKYTLKELEESGKLLPKRALAFVRNLMDEMTDWYGAVDDAAKIGRFLYERQHGKDTIKAIRTAQDVHFDYSLVPKTVGTMRDVNLEKDALLKLGGNPFITYNYKYLSLLNNMVKRYPIETGALIGLSGVYLAPLVVKAYTKLKGIKESSIKKSDALMPSYFDKENVAGFYDPETKMYYYLDLSKTIPGSDLFQKPENHSALEYIAAIGKGLADSIGIFRHPALAVYNATKGKDPFGIPIWHKSDTLGERMIKGAEYIGKTWFMPATIERELRAKTNFHPELARLLGFNVYTYTQKQLENKIQNEINQVAMDASVEERKVLKEFMVKLYKLKQKDLTTDEFNKKLNIYKQEAKKQIEKLEKEKFKKKKDKLRLDKWKAYFDQLKKEKGE